MLWAPPAWRLLHMMTFAYEPKTQKSPMRALFSALPFVLPCKFCRQHLTEHMEVHPLEPALRSRAALSRWLYEIHNAVNASRRLIEPVAYAPRKASAATASEPEPVESKILPDPSFAAVRRVYEERLAAGCSRVEFVGWEFLFTVANQHPFTQEERKSAPIEGAPESVKNGEASILEKNKWNLLNPEERFKRYRAFWEAIGDCLPFEEWREAWHGCGLRMDALKSRAGWIREIRKLYECMEEKLAVKNGEKFEHLCKRLGMRPVAAPPRTTRRKRSS